jgi:hypothetical protein
VADTPARGPRREGPARALVILIHLTTGVFHMKPNQTAARIALAATLLAAGTAFAAGPTNAEYYPFQEIMSMKMLDKNKDGMVSKKEFIDMMNLTWDMNARKMGAKGEAMNADQFKEILMYLKAGG